MGSTVKGSEHLFQDNWEEVKSHTQLTWVLEIRKTLRCVVSVEELMGLLVTSSGVSSAGKGGMCIGIVSRIRDVFIVTSRVISSLDVPFW